MRIRVLPGEYSVCKVERVPAEALEAEFCFVGKTDGELSLVCETALAPAETLAREDGWSLMGIVGELDFGLTGILARIATTLAEAGVPIFAVSTYDTDYLLVKATDLPAARTALAAAGYELV